MIPPEKRITEEEAVACLLSLFSGWQMVELMDRISETSLYRHSLKQKVKLMMPELEKHTDNIAELFGVDTAALNNLFEHRKGLAIKLCDLRPELQAGLNEVLECFFNAPELTMHRLGLKIIKENNK